MNLIVDQILILSCLLSDSVSSFLSLTFQYTTSLSQEDYSDC